MKRLKFPFLASLAAILALGACSSGKSAFEHGNYYEAVMTSVNRLRKNDDHQKSIETLRQAYPMAVAFYEDRAKTSIASNAEFKWTAVVDSYTTINVMYDEIRRSPGALKVIPNPVNYYTKLEEAKRNAAEENYAAGILAMTAGTRDKAKLAYSLFKKTNTFVPGYKDVIKMTETALWNATVKVVMEPIPVQSKNISVSATFFDDKVSEYLHASSLNEFVKFYTLKEAQTLKLKPDHIVKIEFDEFVVGQVYMNEKEIKLEKDSIVVGTYVTNASGKSDPNASGSTTSNTGNNTNTGSGAVVVSGSTAGNTNSGNTNTGGTTGNNNSGNTNTGGNTGNNNSGNTNTGGTTAGNNNSGNTNTGGSTGNNNSGNTNTGGNTGNNSGNNNAGNNNSGNTNAGGNNSGGNNNDGNADNQNSSTPADTVKVTVCHVPPGNEANRHTLVISRSALKAHLAHGDVEGTCESQKPKPKDDKKPGGKPHSMNNTKQPVFFASNDPLSWLAYSEYEQLSDTVKIYTTVKATLFYYNKTTTSKGVLSFKIIDAKTKALLAVEKMPGEYVWISEWATFNGDERALSPQQLQLTKQREKVPPPSQDLFIEFTRPIYDQVITKIKNFYTGY